MQIQQTNPSDDLQRAKDQIGYYAGLTHLVFQVEYQLRFGDVDHSWAGAENIYFLLEPPLVEDSKIDGKLVNGIKSPSYYLGVLQKQANYSEKSKTMEIENVRDFDRKLKTNAMRLFLKACVTGFYYHKILHPYDSRIDLRNLGDPSERKSLTNLASQVTQ